MNTVNKVVLATLGLACAAITVRAQGFSSEELARRAIERRAVEAINWAMPALVVAAQIELRPQVETLRRLQAVGLGP